MEMCSAIRYLILQVIESAKSLYSHRGVRLQEQDTNMNKDSDSARPLLLEKIWLFQDLSSIDRANIAKRLKVRHFVRHELILARNQLSSDVHFVCRGRVRVTSFSKSGKEASFNEKMVGDVFGELAAIDGAPRATDVLALEETSTVSISRDAFWQMLEEYPAVNARLLKTLVGNIRGLTERVFEFTSMGVAARIRKELHRLGVQTLDEQKLGDSSEVSLDPAPKHAELASRVATTREAVTREINTLVKEGLLVKDGPQNLRVLDIEKLGDSID